MSVHSHQPIDPAIAEAASLWLARRDRGLSASEQDEYLHWLGSDARHAEAVAQHAAALERMMQLYEWTPAHDTEPNPELFAPAPARQRTASTWYWLAGLAAAAAVVFAAVLGANRFGSHEQPVAAAPKSYLRVNERIALPDGSRIELKDGANVVVQYSETERRVILNGGEAHFSVWKDRTRPFVVSVAGIEVKAVGTAFNVRLETAQVEVLVTEGRVAVSDDPVPSQASGAATATPAGNPTPLFVSVGERAVVPLASAANAAPAAPSITPVALEEIALELAWQAPRLQFSETPLTDAIAEFNRLNRHQLALGDPAIGALRIGGTFRPDNVEAFVRLISESFYVTGEPAGDNRTVLQRTPDWDDKTAGVRK